MQNKVLTLEITSGTVLWLAWPLKEKQADGRSKCNSSETRLQLRSALIKALIKAQLPSFSLVNSNRLHETALNNFFFFFFPVRKSQRKTVIYIFFLMLFPTFAGAAFSIR